MILPDKNEQSKTEEAETSRLREAHLEETFEADREQETTLFDANNTLPANPGKPLLLAVQLPYSPQIAAQKRRWLSGDQTRA